MKFAQKMILKYIAKAELMEVDEIAMAAMYRRGQLFPDWDEIRLALPKYDLEERKRILDQFYVMMLMLEYK